MGNMSKTKEPVIDMTTEQEDPCLVIKKLANWLKLPNSDFSGIR